MGLKERREREKEERKELVLKSAQQVLIRKGFLATTMNDIAREAELSVGSLYLYFKNKEDIFSELYSRVISHLLNIIKNAAERGASSRERLENIGRDYLVFHKEKKDYFDVFSYFTTFPEIMFGENNRKSLGSKGEGILNIVVSLINTGIKNKEFAITEGEKFAMLYWTSLHGLLQFKKMEDVLGKNLAFDEIYLYNMNYLLDSLR
ncbi:MAG: TetR/AcrR family transcriptional regulator [bacterium]|nr:TetR/AcrR family transcriptional regulator [bacterium]